VTAMTEIERLLDGDPNPEPIDGLDDFSTDAVDSTEEFAAPTNGELTEDAAVDPVARVAAQKSHFARSFREWGLVVIIAIGAAVLMKLFVVQQFYVSGQSMITTLHDFDRVLVNKLSYELHDPNRGDVVVLEESQGLTQRDLIKRVIALPGETIEMKDCVVYINGRVLVEPYLDPNVVTSTNCGPPISPTLIAKHHVFVMGDNRPGSGDSRGGLGPVDYDQIVGRAFVVIWPKSDWQWL
jgi:signal peptidase I